jgi:peptidoglycan/xylan/chitin deacetylase (PgdA/CDA1 family)
VLNVFLTVDTELWPLAPDWPRVALPSSDLAAEFDGYIRGRTASGDFGLPYQIDALNRHGLGATFFVETLFAGKAGMEPLTEIVNMVQDGGHDVQLHLHTEWMAEFSSPDLPQPVHQLLRLYTEDEQTRIVAKGLADLRQAGARTVCAFRAGNFAANFATLRALARNGLLYDSSHNSCFFDSTCHLLTEKPMLQPQMIEGVLEFPVSTFSDYPGHTRPAQLCACSAREMQIALLRAWEAGWSSFVILWHSHELLSNVRSPGRRKPARIQLARFERLCAFLAGHPDKFRISTFSGLDHGRLELAGNDGPIASPAQHAAWRVVEQIASRLL